MESATIAAQGYRFRVPYGTLLCVSDKPLHGEIKLPGQANAFYERAISQHLRIGIETLRILKHSNRPLPLPLRSVSVIAADPGWSSSTPSSASRRR